MFTCPVTTKLEKPLKRELQIKDKPYILTLSPEGLKLTEKGRRKGRELAWNELVGAAGDAQAGSSAPPDEPFGPQAT